MQTPEHVAPQVVEAIAVAVENGLRLPIVYNTSSYDSLKSLELLDGLVDIYMPDFKVIYINEMETLGFQHIVNKVHLGRIKSTH